MSEIDLPPSVLSLVERSPVEDIASFPLRQRLTGMSVFTLIPNDVPDDFVVVRKDDPLGPSHVDEDFQGYADIFVDTFTSGTGGDEKGALLQEAVRVTFRDAWRSKLYVPNRGWITRVRETASATRVTDWATSSGPVQYADLPSGLTRYEAKFSIKWRRDINNSFT